MDFLVSYYLIDLLNHKVGNLFFAEFIEIYPYNVLPALEPCELTFCITTGIALY
jgi:hypothetical protein